MLKFCSEKMAICSAPRFPIIAFEPPGQGRDLREPCRPVANIWAKAAPDAPEAILRVGVDS